MSVEALTFDQVASVLLIVLHIFLIHFVFTIIHRLWGYFIELRGESISYSNTCVYSLMKTMTG